MPRVRARDVAGVGSVTVPLVSVLLTAFEHERLVGDALDSIFLQKTDFPFEVIIGVDASSDATGDAVRRYAHAHPGVVHAIYHARRVGLHQNFHAVHEAARGRYLALLEGDDYWTDDLKLARQVELLENRPDAVVCGHLVKVLSENGGLLGTIPEPIYATTPSRREWVGRLCDFHTSSLVFRNVFGGELPDSVLDEVTRVFDLPLKLELAARGDVAFIPDPMSVFRRLSGSASSAIDDEEWRDIVVRALRNARSSLPEDLRVVVGRRLAELLAGGALSPARAPATRVRLALEGILCNPAVAGHSLARGVYSGLPEGAKQFYREWRPYWREGSNGGKG